MKEKKVSIPSNGSIQFLYIDGSRKYPRKELSQSPLTGQFNFYSTVKEV